MMNTDVKPLISQLVRTPEKLREPASVISRSASIPELISHLKSSFRNAEFARVEEILTERVGELRTEIERLKRERVGEERAHALTKLAKVKMEEEAMEMGKRIRELSDEKAVFELKLEELERRTLRLEEEVARKVKVDVEVIQKMAEEWNGENEEARGGDAPVECDSPGDANGKVEDPLPAIQIIESDDEGGRKEVPLPLISLSKRKRSSNEIDDDENSSAGKQKTRSVEELNRSGMHSLPLEPEIFIRPCDDKVVGKYSSHLSARSSGSHKLNEISSSDSDEDPCSDKNMELLVRWIKETEMFSSEADLRSSFEKDPELCMKAVCALYRQQICPNTSSSDLSLLSQSDRVSINALGEYLVDCDPVNKLRKAVAEVRAKDHAECKRLATEYCHQLYKIYSSKVDSLFCPGAVFRDL